MLCVTSAFILSQPGFSYHYCPQSIEKPGDNAYAWSHLSARLYNSPRNGNWIVKKLESLPAVLALI